MPIIEMLLPVSGGIVLIEWDSCDNKTVSAQCVQRIWKTGWLDTSSKSGLGPVAFLTGDGRMK